MVDISDALSEQEKVKFTVHTKVSDRVPWSWMISMGLLDCMYEWNVRERGWGVAEGRGVGREGNRRVGVGVGRGCW